MAKPCAIAADCTFAAVVASASPTATSNRLISTCSAFAASCRLVAFCAEARCGLICTTH